MSKQQQQEQNFYGPATKRQKTDGTTGTASQDQTDDMRTLGTRVGATTQCRKDGQTLPKQVDCRVAITTNRTSALLQRVEGQEPGGPSTEATPVATLSSFASSSFQAHALAGLLSVDPLCRLPSVPSHSDSYVTDADNHKDEAVPTAFAGCAEVGGTIQDQAFLSFTAPPPIDEEEFLSNSFSPSSSLGNEDMGSSPVAASFMDASFMDAEDGEAIAAIAGALPECAGGEFPTEKDGNWESEAAPFAGVVMINSPEREDGAVENSTVLFERVDGGGEGAQTGAATQDEDDLELVELLEGAWRNDPRFVEWVKKQSW